MADRHFWFLCHAGTRLTSDRCDAWWQVLGPLQKRDSSPDAVCGMCASLCPIATAATLPINLALGAPTPALTALLWRARWLCLRLGYAVLGEALAGGWDGGNGDIVLGSRLLPVASTAPSPSPLLAPASFTPPACRGIPSKGCSLAQSCYTEAGKIFCMTCATPCSPVPTPYGPRIVSYLRLKWRFDLSLVCRPWLLAHVFLFPFLCLSLGQQTPDFLSLLLPPLCLLLLQRYQSPLGHPGLPSRTWEHLQDSGSDSNKTPSIASTKARHSAGAAARECMQVMRTMRTHTLVSALHQGLHCALA